MRKRKTYHTNTKCRVSSGVYKHYFLAVPDAGLRSELSSTLSKEPLQLKSLLPLISTILCVYSGNI